MRRVNIRIIIYRDDMLLMGRTLPEIIMARDIDFSIATFGLCDQPQKISPAPCETNIVSGLSNRYRENYFFYFRGKIKTCVSTMPAYFKTTKNFSLKSHRVNWPDELSRPFYQLEFSFNIVNRRKY